MKNLKKPFIKLYLYLIKGKVWISVKYKMLFYDKRLLKKQKKAYKMFLKTGYQFHIVNISDGNIGIVNRNFDFGGDCISLKKLNKANRKLGRKELNMTDIKNMAIYSTPENR
jgi:hypothetical protein